MPFSLPKSCLHVGHIPLSSLKVQLIERNINWNCLSLALCFPVNFLHEVVVFGNSLLNCVPESNAFDKIVTYSVVRNGEGESCKCKSVDGIKCAHNMVINSCKGWNFKLVSGEELIGFINVNMPFFPVFGDMVFNLVHVNVRHPTINIHDCKEEVFSWKVHLLELELHLLGTPSNIGPFTFVLIFSELVTGVVNFSEFRVKFIHKFLGFDIRALFMFLHGQVHKVSLFRPFMSSQHAQGFSENFHFFFVVGNDNRLVNFLSYFISFLWIWGHYPLENSPILVNQIKANQSK